MEARAYFSDSDALLDSGRHPSAFQYGHYLIVPQLLILNEGGDILGVRDCNAGYGGTGPHNTHRVLRMLGFSETAAEHVFRARVLHLAVDRDEALLAERNSRTQVITPRLVDDHLVVEYADRWTVRWGRDPLEWVRQVLNDSSLPAWLRGPRLARYYLDPDKAVDDGFVPRHGGHAVSMLVIQQGQLQLWISVTPPHHPTQRFSHEALELLAEAGFEVDRANPHDWLGRLLLRFSDSPSYIDLPEGAAQVVWTPPTTRS